MSYISLVQATYKLSAISGKLKLWIWFCYKHGKIWCIFQYNTSDKIWQSCSIQHVYSIQWNTVTLYEIYTNTSEKWLVVYLCFYLKSSIDRVTTLGDILKKFPASERPNSMQCDHFYRSVIALQLLSSRGYIFWDIMQFCPIEVKRRYIPKDNSS